LGWESRGSFEAASHRRYQPSTGAPRTDSLRRHVPCADGWTSALSSFYAIHRKLWTNRLSAWFRWPFNYGTIARLTQPLGFSQDVR